MSTEKIKTLDELAHITEQLRSSGQKVIHCHGTFDLMHTGHIKHLQLARSLGHVLIVTITSDDFVRKGPGRPVFSELLRAENLAALSCVDFLAISNAETAILAIEKIKPFLYVKGSDYADPTKDTTGNISLEIEAVRSNGGDIYFTDEITFSSTKLLNTHFDVLPQDTRLFLEQFKQTSPLSSFLEHIQSLKSLNVLVIGDTIIDEYHYVHTLGQTGKGTSLAVRHQSEERFAGGAVAVANHIAGFTQNVTLLTALGKDDGIDYIKSKLKSNVTLEYRHFQNAPTLIKRRFVDQDLQRLFEVYFGGEEEDNPDLEQDFCSWIEQYANDYDLVIVPDFGNGMISKKMAKTISHHARFLVVNTQINSGNRGYHIITRYPKADFICLNEPEARLATHDRQSPLEDVAMELLTRLDSRAVAITRGLKGALIVDKQSTLAIPALSSHVVDRIGAGDAFLSLGGLFMAVTDSTPAAVLAGSIAAALDVQIVCNREPVDPVLFAKYATTLLK
ncbi:PfkB family carbohydrate kinase [Aquitalea magnusonii]|uniref:RfaE bifunctional protein kinase chain/domain/rfaE bifunctional protein nucleotidyltransferase chain/domain n=1 Tax=Aquitalea magnusonii TaxID=332411 RepID=A0A318JC01_9NEIS|nr:PfkB family carbohydrate kinase [Aquitalea magnusonii]PXX44369.1 rfaE bifunctional protein kinase chain/domain/rfaE bifunctional protein nucleotidyltransferase chain/domain [Aquitalea magnusonii]